MIKRFLKNTPKKASITSFTHPKHILSLIPLTCIVIGSMIGSEIFNLPQNMSQESGVFANIIAWIIGGTGMLSIGLTFLTLTKKTPHVQGSVYGYAKALGGDYLAFNSAYIYWISALLGNVGFIIMVFSALGYFFPMLGHGNTIPAIICASVVVWVIFFLIQNGITGAALLNSVITISKLLPLILLIIVIIFLFNTHDFKLNFNPPHLDSIINQVKKNMLLVLFTFIGIEGASIYSGRAKSIKDVGSATILGFFITLILLMLVNIISLGVTPREVILNLAPPITADLLSMGIGKIGIVIINIGIVVSVLGAFLAWTLLATEIPYLAAKDVTFPKSFYKVNKKNTPTISLFASCLIMQIFLILSYFEPEAYYLAITLCASTVLIPYILSSLFLLKAIIFHGESKNKHFSKFDIIIAVTSLAFAIWVLYAEGLNYLLMSMLIYGAGIFIYIWAKKGSGLPLFVSKFDKILAIFVVLLFIIALCFIKTLV